MIDAKIKEAWLKYTHDDLSGCGIFIFAYVQAEARARMFKWQRDHPKQSSLTLADYEVEVRKELSE